MNTKSNFFVPLSHDVDIRQVGGKAKNLSRVQALGVRAPTTLVLQREALRFALLATNLTDRVNDFVDSFHLMTNTQLVEGHRQLTDALLAEGLPEPIRDELAVVVDNLKSESRFGLAIRSSAVYEDSASASFAGVFESWIGVHDPTEAEKCILQCWSSSWAPRALRYLKRMGIPPQINGMAVMLQPVVNAQKSGVIYTANPDTGDPNEFFIRATPGLAIDLMSGSGDGDSFRIDVETFKTIDRKIVTKTKSIIATREGPRPNNIHGSASSHPTLADNDLHDLGKVARRLDEHFVSRLDIEFAFAEDGLWIVQSRPLTALPPFFPHELAEKDKAKTWKLAEFIIPLRADLPTGMQTPLYADISDAEMWSRHQPKDIVLAVFCTDERDLQGYRYFLAEPPPMFANFFDSPAEYEPWLDANANVYQQRWDHYADELAGMTKTATEAIRETTTSIELIPIMFDVRDRLQDLNSFGWSGPQSLGWMCDMLLADFVKKFDSTLETGQLIGGGMNSYTFRVTRGLQQLGSSIHEDSVQSAFASLPLDEVLPHLLMEVPGCDFLEQLDAFCWRFGKAPPTWRDRPPFWNAGRDTNTMMHTIRCAYRESSKDVEEVRAESQASRDAVEKELRNRIAKESPVDMQRFDKILHWARYWGQALNDRHELAVGLLWERELIWQTGKRLVNDGLLEKEEDVLSLYRQDLEGLDGVNSTDVARQRFAERTREFRSRLRLTAPAMVGAESVAQAVPATSAAEEESPNEQTGKFMGHGIGVNVVIGLARHVPDLSDPALLDALRPDDILVLPHEQAFHYADWHSILTLVTAVVSPGQPSHHLAQVARECGVPVIGHVQGDLRSIADNARLRVDPKSGTVHVLD